MDTNKIFDKLLKELELIGGLYDVIRLVDPVHKKVVAHSKIETPNDEKSKCFSFWNRNISCENCITMRAANQHKAVVKIEYRDPNVYLITAVPVGDKKEKLVAELLKDITKDGVIDIEGSAEEIAKIIGRRNSQIVRDAFTRIYNENYIEERLPYDLEKSIAEKRSLGLFAFEIDNLDRINDVDGFEKGDELLRKTASMIKRYCRKQEDWAARHYGSGYILVMYDVDENQAYRLSKRIHDKFEKTDFSFSVKPEFRIGFIVTKNKPAISIQASKPAKTAQQLILEASKNMYAGIDESIDQYSERFENEVLPKFTLTAREREVAVLLLKGYSNTEMAKELFVGISTVKKHVSNIFMKSDVGSRAEFIAKVKG